MNIHESVRNSAILLMQQNAKGNLDIVGTAFIVEIHRRIEEKSLKWFYLTTARHVVEESRGVGRPVFVRINSAGEGFQDVPVDLDKWFLHPATDVATMRFDPPSGLDLATVPESILLPSSELGKLREGQDVCYITLFSQYYGKAKVQPLVRRGLVSLIPREPIRVKTGYKTYGEVNVFLIETLCWPGHSGSPVFVDSPQNPGHIALVGVLTGHFPLRAKLQSSELELPWEDPKEADLTNLQHFVHLNSGIATVVPSQELLTLLADPEIDAARSSGTAYSI